MSLGEPLSTHDTNQFLLCHEGLGMTAGFSFFNLHLSNEKLLVKAVIPIAINIRHVKFVLTRVSK